MSSRSGELLDQGLDFSPPSSTAHDRQAGPRRAVGHARTRPRQQLGASRRGLPSRTTRSASRHALVTLAEQPANEIVVDARGNIYINGADFDFVGGGAPRPGYIKLVPPDGQLRQVAGDIQLPNGMVITPDNRTLIISESLARRLTAFDIGPEGGLSGRRVFADGLGPDGITMDAEGAVWTGTTDYVVVRVAEGGEVLQRVELAENRAPLALMLGGPDRRTLFICTVE